MKITICNFYLDSWIFLQPCHVFVSEKWEMCDFLTVSVSLLCHNVYKMSHLTYWQVFCGLPIKK